MGRHTVTAHDFKFFRNYGVHGDRDVGFVRQGKADLHVAAAFPKAPDGVPAGYLAAKGIDRDQCAAARHFPNLPDHIRIRPGINRHACAEVPGQFQLFVFDVHGDHRGPQGRRDHRR